MFTEIFLENCFQKYFVIKMQILWLKKTAIRRMAFGSFMERISHLNVYTRNDIVSSNDVYDIFICGNNQVWNPCYLRSEFLLNFVQSGKKKYFYAASIGKDTLNSEESVYLNLKAKDFLAVSLCEQMSMSIFERQTS